MREYASNGTVDRWILQVLDDYKSHDWDDAMIAVSDGLRRCCMATEPRQEENCLRRLIERGEVEERWVGEWASLRRVKLDAKPGTVTQLTLFVSD